MGVTAGNLKRMLGEDAPIGSFDARQSLTYSGESAFKLYDTFGVPLDFIMTRHEIKASSSIKPALMPP